MIAKSVLIIGGGLAGLSAAVRLAQRNFRVTILESRDRLGGRASSFRDPLTGEWIDTCQHVALGCCKRYHAFCKTIGVVHLFDVRGTLTFQTLDRRMSRFRADPWPAPFHLARSFASTHFLTADEKLRIGYGLARLLVGQGDVSLHPFLLKHYQTPGTIRKFWNLILVSALNDTVENVGTKYARKVFADAFVWNKTGYEMHVPNVPLARLYGRELQAFFAKYGVNVELNASAKTMVNEGNSVQRIIGRDGTDYTSDQFLLAVPFERVLDLLPETWREMLYFQNLNRIQHSPITSVHFRFDRDVMFRSDIVVVDGLSQWLFARSPREIQVVISAAEEVQTLGNELILDRVTRELHSLLPDTRLARIEWSKVISDRQSTFRVSPGIDQFRPSQITPIANLRLAGDYTLTGWPATMEGAVISGELAADSI